MEVKVERLYRYVLYSLFAVVFVGVAASADHSEALTTAPAKDIISLIRDVKVVQEANAINNNTWTQDVSDINENGLSKVEELLSQDEQGLNNHITE
jgi:hypothetical protein